MNRHYNNRMNRNNCSYNRRFYNNSHRYNYYGNELKYLDRNRTVNYNKPLLNNNNIYNPSINNCLDNPYLYNIQYPNNLVIRSPNQYIMNSPQHFMYNNPNHNIGYTNIGIGHIYHHNMDYNHYNDGRERNNFYNDNNYNDNNYNDNNYNNHNHNYNSQSHMDQEYNRYDSRYYTPPPPPPPKSVNPKRPYFSNNLNKKFESSSFNTPNVFNFGTSKTYDDDYEEQKKKNQFGHEYPSTTDKTKKKSNNTPKLIIRGKKIKTNSTGTDTSKDKENAENSGRTLIFSNSSNEKPPFDLLRLITPLHNLFSDEESPVKQIKNTKKELRKKELEELQKYEFEIMDEKIESIDDLISIGLTYEKKI